MQAQPEDTVRAADSEQAQRDVQSVAGMGASAINIALIIAFWGQWRTVFVIVAVAVGLILFNEQ